MTRWKKSNENIWPNGSLSFLLLSMSAVHLAAQTTPTNIKATETPWTVACRPVTAEGKIDCEMTKQLRAVSPASLIAQISVMSSAQGLSVRIIAPHQLSIANGLSLSVDDKDAGARQFTTSISAGIVALFALDDELLDATRKGQSLKVSAKTRADQDFSFAISLAGFAATMDKLLQ
jgi:invasion protein IalB